MFDNPISTIFKYVPYRDGLCSKVEDNAYSPDAKGLTVSDWVHSPVINELTH